VNNFRMGKKGGWKKGEMRRVEREEGERGQDLM
jgi:hypothetical protein